MKNYSLKNSLKIFCQCFKVYQRKKDTIDKETSDEIKYKLYRLKEFLSCKDKAAASKEAKSLEKLVKTHFPLSIVTKFAQNFAYLAVALFFAIIIRQSCFENMEIPSGSMRPTFRECDKLVVSKTQFGINIPLMPKHILFSPNSVKRMGTVVFTGEGMDIADVNTRYFYIFPGVKKFVKRMIGLPGDKLYFYGGKIYGVDKDGNDITPLLQQEELAHLEYIPFININGRVQSDSYGYKKHISSVTLEQNHLAVASFNSDNYAQISGTVLQPNSSDIHTLWGMGNYAMSRIVSSEKLYFSNKTVDLLLEHPNCKYFLELTHHASVNNPGYIYDYRGVKRPSPGNSISYIPLNEELLKRIWDNMYTSRFTSDKGYLQHFGKKYNSSFQLKDRPKVKGRPDDGAYEFLDGIAYKVQWQNDPLSMFPSLAIPKKLDDSHPFASFSEKKCVTFYNMGIEQSKFIATNTHMGIAPSRYAYYRDGNLYLMGAKILSKEESSMQAFITSEEQKILTDSSYVPFVDAGAPLLADGTIDADKVTTYGLHVPEKSYYVLGDNHAQSGDSREFGFLPEDNIRGTTSFLFWAPGGRFGAPLQKPYAWFNSQKVIVWTLLISGIALYYVRERRKFAYIKNTPLEKLKLFFLNAL